jgi:hypothetical protein
LEAKTMKFQFPMNPPSAVAMMPVKSLIDALTRLRDAAQAQAFADAREALVEAEEAYVLVEYFRSQRMTATPATPDQDATRGRSRRRRQGKGRVAVEQLFEGLTAKVLELFASAARACTTEDEGSAPEVTADLIGAVDELLRAELAVANGAELKQMGPGAELVLDPACPDLELPAV